MCLEGNVLQNLVTFGDKLVKKRLEPRLGITPGFLTGPFPLLGCEGLRAGPLYRIPCQGPSPTNIGQVPCKQLLK